MIEDDHSGDIATGALVSAGSWLPQRTVHIRSYSKSHGPDLRLAAVGGAGDVVTAVANRRLLGPDGAVESCRRCCWKCSMTNRRSPRSPTRGSSTPGADSSSPTCSRPRDVAVTGSDGINLWMTVADERSALVTLAAQGIGAAPGEPFQVRDDTPHLRVTVGLIESDHERIADQLAAAAGGSRSPTRSLMELLLAVRRPRRAHRGPTVSSRSPGCRCGNASWRSTICGRTRSRRRWRRITPR